MTPKNKNIYFFVKDKHGNRYLCPIDGIGGGSSSASDRECDDCVEVDIVERYAGNFEIKS